MAIAGGRGNSIALKADGTVAAWGNGNTGVAGLSNIVAIGGRDNCCYGSWEALQADGGVMYGTVFSGAYGPFGSNIVAISTSRGTDGSVSLSLYQDGTVAGSGYNFDGSVGGGPLVIPGLSNVIAVASGDYVYLVLIGNGPPALGPPLISFGKDANGFAVSVTTRSGRVYRLEYKDALEDSDWIGLPLVAGNGGVRTLSDSTAGGAQRFYRVRHW